jgi:hypothetical protein
MEEDMKTILRHILTMALLLGAAFYALSTDAAAQAATTYPLVCRGDKGAVIEDDGPPRGVSLKFKKGSAAATSGLAPGECSWLDRGLSAAEPDILVQPTKQLRADEAAVSTEYKWTDDLKDADKYWTFEVYSDSKGQLIITGSHKGNAADSGGVLLLGGSNPGGVIRRIQTEVSLAKPPEETKKTVTVATPLGEGIDVEAFAKAPKAPLYFLGKEFGGGVFSTGFYVDCFYTASVEEKGYAVGLGFSFRAVVGYVLKTQLPGTVPVYRLFKDHDHFLTTDEEEKGYAKGLGYAYEGVLGYVSKMPLPGTKPLYRVFLKTHCYDTVESFRTSKKFEKVEAYVWTSP